VRSHKSIRLKEYDYSQLGGYFVTICTHKRECILGEIVDGEVRLSPFGEIAERHWDEIPRYFPGVELDASIIMPNHIHGIIVMNKLVGAIHESPLRMTRKQRRNMILSKIIGRFKMTAAKEINLLRNTMGSQIWQRNYYEHIIRNDRDLNNIRDYVVNNPLQWFHDDENPDRLRCIAH
jgi:putative transposase